MEINMYNENEEKLPPCLFGPGGEYRSAWPRQSENSPQTQAGGLTRILTLIEGILHKMGVGPENCHLGTSLETNQIFSGKDIFTYASGTNKTEQQVNAKANANIKNNFRFSEHPMLFPNDWGAGKGIVHKPKHRIRTHNSPAKKRSAHRFAGQGSLF